MTADNVDLCPAKTSSLKVVQVLQNKVLNDLCSTQIVLLTQYV